MVNFLTPYKLDIPQGNQITMDQLENLKVGMTQSQVRFLLGTPLLVDPFHQDRWEYIYRDEKSGDVKVNKRFSIIFENNMVARWEGEVLPEPAARKEARVRASAVVSDEQLMRSKVNPGAPDSKQVEVKPLIDKGF
ncbi:outer membrane protein assembly factor BamE [Chitinibacter tainanensis]|uniref:outer membrane protein assembly factor BamE n=1 Tax=Chitinibacter tainanensis TaxID=230667 RepID=UPI0023557844|nr:outer membrane protein assembly factor BamE [Chitinibacter tainanensis]